MVDIRLALVYATTMGQLAVLCVNAPGHNGRIYPWSALNVAKSGSADGSV